MMAKVLEFILLLLQQFAGGPGPVENNLVRFGLPAILWAILFYIAWTRQRNQDLPREKLLVWGFGLAFLRELYMFSQMAWRLIVSNDGEVSCDIFQPFEHGLAMAAMIVVAGAFLRYILEDRMVARRYLQIGIVLTILVFIVTSITWPRQLAAFPQIKFHQTWAAWLFHIPLSILMAVAVFMLLRKKGWLSNVVASALTLYLFSELLLLLNYATDQAYKTVICPIGNSLHILAIPLLGYVYLHEQSIEKKQAEEALIAYRDHLEELVDNRTTELTTLNQQLKQEVSERTQAEEALERVTRRYELILESAGEGICGIDRQGFVTFANPAAASKLGYTTEEMTNRLSHSIWHQTKLDGSLYPLDECPIYQGYSQGIQCYGDDEYFWRKDGTGFPVRYFSNPVWEKGELVGAVVVFRDITERKRNEAEIAQQTASLATQNAVAATLSRSLDIEENMKNVLDMLRVETEMDFGLIFLLDPESRDLLLQFQSGEQSIEEFQPFTFDKGACRKISHQALYRKQAVTAAPIDLVESNGVSCADLAGIRSLVSVPLVSKGKALGVMTFGTKQVAAIQPHKQELLTAIGQQIGMAIENARLYRDVENWAEELSRLQQASSYLTESFDFDRVTAEIARQSTRLLKCQKACILHTNLQTNQMELAAGFGLNQKELRVFHDQLPEWAFLTEFNVKPMTIAIQDVSSDRRLPEKLKIGLRLKAVLFVPIWTSEKPQAFIVLLDMQTTRLWGPCEMELIERLANRAAIALVNVNLHHQLELAAALNERQRIAANMHDGLAQTLSLLGLRVDRMQDLVRDGSVLEAEEAVCEIREAVNNATKEVRRSIASLQEAPRPARALQDLLKDLLEQSQSEDGPELCFDPGSSKALFIPSDQADHVIMVVQEALLNAIRHAHAQSVTIRLEETNARFSITIKDDGNGFDPEASNLTNEHFGLSIMKARAERIGGNFQIEFSPGGGTRIKLTWTPETSKT